ncbi:hypothetical protein St703_10120 [Sporolactobacillus terrae]|uniref:Uncharacterized protein n=1 Tax=Sporolactobacillus terrae TaxID=269673 RepID=A0A5K7WVC5_9BACL|nr:hypothetical protein St703_10120 [Sporolactobacillus terrae]
MRALFAGCTDAQHSTDDRQIPVNVVLVKGLKHGEVSGMPLSLNDGFDLDDVKKVWGRAGAAH